MANEPERIGNRAASARATERGGDLLCRRHPAQAAGPDRDPPLRVGPACRSRRKAEVLAFGDGTDPPIRRAFAIVLDKSDGKAYEAVISLPEAAVESWEHIPGVQPQVMLEEFFECEEIVKTSPEVQDALAAERDHRVRRCHGRPVVGRALRRRGRGPAAARPGLGQDRRPARQRLRPPDRGPDRRRRPERDAGRQGRGPRRGPGPPGVRPLLPRPTSARCASDIKPLEITQPEGPSFEVDGHQVRWQNWSFVIGFNAREGLTLHHLALRRRAAATARSSTAASLTEMVVPYGDPAPTQQAQERLRRRRVRHGHVRQQPGARLRLPGPDPLLRRPPVRQPRRAADDQERHLHARGGLRHPLEAHRPPPARRAGGPPLAAAGRLLDLDGRELRVRLLLVPLPGRHHPVRGQAHRHPVARRASPPGETPKYGSPRRAAALRARPPALLQRPARLRPRRPGQLGLRGRRRVRAAGRGQPVRQRLLRQGRRCCGPRRRPRPTSTWRRPRTWKVVNPAVKNAVGEPVGYKFLPGDNVGPLRLAATPGGASGPGSSPSRLGHALRATTSSTRPATTPTSTRAATACPSGPSRTGRSRTPTSSSGTRSATPRARGPRTTR